MIHYHGIPVTGSADNAPRFYRGRHLFCSFAAPDHLKIGAKCCQSFALDNGAFSAWTKGKPLDLKGYTDWVREWHRHPAFDFAIIPDVIDGDERENDAMLLDWIAPFGLRPWLVPVWHLHESLTRFQRLAATWPRVALGSSGEWSTPGSESWWGRMAEAMGAICIDGRPTCKLHGLRMLSTEIFPKLPLASADSTNASRNGQRECPTNPIAGANCIADRIEIYPSADRYVQELEPMLLF